MVPALIATTDERRVQVIVSAMEAGATTLRPLFSTMLYAIDGRVEVTDLDVVAETFMKERGVCTCTLQVVIADQTATIPCLHCEAVPPVGFTPSTALLLSTETRRVHFDSTLTVASLQFAGDTAFRFTAVGRDAGGSGQLLAVSCTVTRAADVNHTVRFTVAELVATALGATCPHTGRKLADVVYFSLECAGHNMLYYLTPEAAYLTFSFRNQHNVEEFVDVAGTLASKTEADRNIAVCGGRMVPYDRNVARTFEVATGALISPEVPMMEQFLTSHEVKLHYEGAVYDVVITDHTFEPGTDPDSLPTAKFTWRFALNRPRLTSSLLLGIMPTRRNVFSNAFTAEYE